MTDLSDWGGGIDHAEDEADDGPVGTEDDESRVADRARCRALTSSGQRCQGSDSRDEDGLCPSHSRDSNVLTIDDDPAYLIGATAGDIWPNPAENIDGWDEIKSGLQEVSGFHWE